MNAAQYKTSSHRSEVTRGDSRKGAKRAFNRASRRAAKRELAR